VLEHALPHPEAAARDHGSLDATATCASLKGAGMITASSAANEGASAKAATASARSRQRRAKVG